MVKKLSIGVIGIQGAISEHINIMRNALDYNGISGEVFVVKKPEEIKKIDDNVGRNIESLDPHPLPTITDWYREKEEKGKQQIFFL